ncbi:MAG: alpha/beta hydrolase [Paraburkholderia tropica]|uniref:Pimeloyl-ACP methyl ester carboxylesterase n=1 Tax=Paraburkholderia tropica TaxID=92647 RepID=A0ABX5MKP8_9BURK|nr:alpha/beta hydrolase [Paraburkholderia tropica]PXX12566.1 pimeloyl-ACP methyl ester carboxylesterase [Paraburkholderia tropica]PZW76543.1 pimeloyl-ACP methyl ester carboxylesterase [Paraburkholderia tropica]
MPICINGKTSIYYEEHGAGVPLVLLHGVGSNHASWFHQVQALHDRYRVITFDARGFGNSNDVEDIGRDAFLSDLETLLDILEIDHAVLVGQSMGGGTAVSFACTHPDRVRALVLADTAVGLELPSELAGEVTAIRESAANLTQIQRVLGASTRHTRPDLAMLYSQIASFNKTNFRTIKGTQPLWPIDVLANTRLPILFIVGEEDILYPPGIIGAIHRRIATSQIHIIQGAGHSAFYEKPELFDQLLDEWLQGILTEEKSVRQ